jgi:hypothetical protein
LVPSESFSERVAVCVIVGMSAPFGTKNYSNL